jgi:hypothetical protein
MVFSLAAVLALAAVLGLVAMSADRQRQVRRRDRQLAKSLMSAIQSERI